MSRRYRQQQRNGSPIGCRIPVILVLAGFGLSVWSAIEVIS